MDEEIEILAFLKEIIGEEGCGVSCKDAELIKDEEGWHLMLEGFMAPWPIGKTVAEAKDSIKEYASQGFGLT